MDCTFLKEGAVDTGRVLGGAVLAPVGAVFGIVGIVVSWVVPIKYAKVELFGKIRQGYDAIDLVLECKSGKTDDKVALVQQLVAIADQMGKGHRLPSGLQG